VILILTMHSGPTADPVERLLWERGADVVRFDPGDFPERAACSMRFQRATGWQRTLERRGERPIDLDEVSAVWLRRPGARTAPAAITDEHARNYLLAERTAVVADHVTTDGASRRLPKLPGRIFPLSELMLAPRLGQRRRQRLLWRMRQYPSSSSGAMGASASSRQRDRTSSDALN